MATTPLARKMPGLFLPPWQSGLAYLIIESLSKIRDIGFESQIFKFLLLNTFLHLLF